MFVVQSSLRPAAIQDALRDLMRDGLSRVRICSAYLSLMGSRLLLDAIKRNARVTTWGMSAKRLLRRWTSG